MTTANPPVIDTVNTLRDAGHQVIFCSGRPERDDRGYGVRAATRRWLGLHLGEWADDSLLLMRGQGDRRPDHVVKRELFNAHIRDAYDVLLAWTTVIEWWPCGARLQVDEGNF
ncbi:hypothetical protein AB0P17_15895 [Streptomyces sp. NPDC088124]|uniref:phosphatase domain-containing protein n=1 Tax=Streptomyces sp. NPDC088124 TaxID=3154654 RepID=UPI00341FE25B